MNEFEGVIRLLWGYRSSQLRGASSSYDVGRDPKIHLRSSATILRSPGKPNCPCFTRHPKWLGRRSRCRACCWWAREREHHRAPSFSVRRKPFFATKACCWVHAGATGLRLDPNPRPLATDIRNGVAVLQPILNLPSQSSGMVSWRHVSPIQLIEQS